MGSLVNETRMPLAELLSALGPEAEEVEDSEQETFLLFAQSLPSNSLGFVDSKATTLDLIVAGRSLTIHQSPTLLSSNRELGTTGAVTWQVTPRFAEWIASENFLFERSILDQDSKVLELGCGSSGVLAIVLSPKVGHYIATDQPYVERLLRWNLAENPLVKHPRVQKNDKSKKRKTESPLQSTGNTEFLGLDWETSMVSDLATNSNSKYGFDLLLALDCIYNEALVGPFVRTCAEICRLRPGSMDRQTLCCVAQQLRSDTVFERWLCSFLKEFRVWRIPDRLLTDELKESSGFVVHIGIIRDA